MSRDELETIVFVDDDPDIRDVTTLALADIGGLSVTAFPGGQALLDNLPATPDLLLLDVMMPSMNGPTLLRRLRTLPGYESVPAIFMTAKVQPAEIDALTREGAIGVVAKPYDPMQLADQLRGMWRQHTS